MIKLSLCPVCKSSQIYIYAKKQSAYDKHFSSRSSIILNVILRDILKKDEVEINTMRCRNCGHFFLSPTFSTDEISEMYSQRSEKFAEIKQIYELKTKEKWEYGLGGDNWLEKREESLLKRPEIIRTIIDKYTAFKKNKILDIGGGSGYNLSGFRNEAKLFVMDLVESKERVKI